MKSTHAHRTGSSSPRKELEMEFNETTRQTALISCTAWEEPGEGVIRVSSPAVVSLSSPVGADELLFTQPNRISTVWGLASPCRQFPSNVAAQAVLLEVSLYLNQMKELNHCPLNNTTIEITGVGLQRYISFYDVLNNTFI